MANNFDFEESNFIITKCSFYWTISEFTSKANVEILESPSFYAGSNDLTEWNLRAYPNGYNENTDGHLSLLLCMLSSYESVVFAEYEFSILHDTKIKANRVNSDKIRKFIKSKNWAILKFIKRDLLLDVTNGFITDDDKLTIVCDITVFGNNEKKFFDARLPHHFQQILSQKKFCDVTLVVGDKEFQAHKAILAARSPVFSAMFEHKMKESLNNRIEIDDIEPHVLEAMLYFIYTDKTPNLNKIAEDLLAAADKYDLIRLKHMCEAVLRLNLTTEKAAKILILSHLHNVDQLKEISINYISTHIKEVMETEGFKLMLSHSDLLIEILKAVTLIGSYHFIQ